MSSRVFPTGVYGCPPSQVALAMTSAVLSYLEQYASRASLQELHLVDINQTLVTRIADTMAEAAKHKGVQCERFVGGANFELTKDAPATPYADALKGKPGSGAAVAGVHGNRGKKSAKHSKGTEGPATRSKTTTTHTGHEGNDADWTPVKGRKGKQGRGRGSSAGQPGATQPAGKQPVAKQSVAKKPAAAAKEDEEDDTCSICMGDFTNKTVLPKCKHAFCKACIEECFQKMKPACPNCGTMYGEVTGNQPDGTMTHSTDNNLRLPGHEGYGTIVINYNFPNGTQTVKSIWIC